MECIKFINLVQYNNKCSKICHIFMISFSIGSPSCRAFGTDDTLGVWHDTKKSVSIPICLLLPICLLKCKTLWPG